MELVAGEALFVALISMLTRGKREP